MTIGQLMINMVNKKSVQTSIRFTDLAEISDRNEERKRKNVRKMDNET